MNTEWPRAAIGIAPAVGWSLPYLCHETDLGAIQELSGDRHEKHSAGALRYCGGHRWGQLFRKTGGASIDDIVVVQKTPCTVSLDPRGGYFRGQSYTLRLELDGYQTTEVALTPKMSGWYWGNLVIGGLIGMLAVEIGRAHV